jgi:carbonic anhydrase
MKPILFAMAVAAMTPHALSAARDMPLTAAEQAALTPQQVLESLMAGNKRYVAGQLTSPNVKARIQAAAQGQYPQAVILSCLDSRVPVELVFDQGIGDIFVGRVAGNVENTDQLGSMEFATRVAGAKLVMVLGHEACGAVKGACDDVKMGNLTELLDKIKPAITAVEGFDASARNSSNKKFVAAVVEQNVRQTLADIRKHSSVLAEMEQQGEIMIVGALYSLADGSVRLIQ